MDYFKEKLRSFFLYEYEAGKTLEILAVFKCDI